MHANVNPRKQNGLADGIVAQSMAQFSTDYRARSWLSRLPTTDVYYESEKLFGNYAYHRLSDEKVKTIFVTYVTNFHEPTRPTVLVDE